MEFLTTLYNSNNKKVIIPIKNIISFKRFGDIHSYTDITGGGGGGSSISGAIIGGVVAGEAGAIIGSRKKTEEIKTKNIVVDKRVTIVEINDDNNLYVEGIIDNRIKEVTKKLNGSITLLNRLLKPINATLDNSENIYIALFIDYKLTDVEEFGLTGDIGLLRDQIDEYSEKFTETMIFTNKKLKEMEELIKQYSFEYK